MSFSLTKLSKIVDHDKSYSFETDFGWFIRFNAKKEHIWNKMSFSLTLYRQRFSLRKTHFLPLKRFLKCYGAKCH